MEITEFVAARLDEDEAVAKAAMHAGTGRWERTGSGQLWDHDRDGDLERVVIPDEGMTTSAEFAHIARHDPARALREITAKRRRLERYLEQDGYDLPEGVNDGRDPDERECDATAKAVLEYEVREDAAVWSDHPDYEQEWAL